MVHRLRALLLVVCVLMVAPAFTRAQKIARLDLEGPLMEQPGPLDWLAGGQPTLRTVIAALEEAATDDDIAAVVVRLKDAELNRTQIEELGAMLDLMKQVDKKVYVFAENYGPGELLLASHAHKAVVQSGGGVSFPGIGMQEIFLADTFAWAGVKADLVQIGDYKGANEMFVNSAPSKAWEENINQLLDGLYGAMRDEIKKGRKLSDERLDHAMQTAWMCDGADAVNVGLIDAEVDLPALGEFITGKADAQWTVLDATTPSRLKLDTSNPFAALPALMKALSEPPHHTPKGPAIAVLHVTGPIVDGDSTAGGLFGEQTVGSRTMRNALEEIRAEDKIKGVVVRIDSPGGSATASEVIWLGVRRCAEKKPVWVSVGSMAASGGYYIAVAGDKIYLNPSSIVGSIGVVGGKFSMGGLFDKLKVRVVERSRGPMGDLFNTVNPWTPDQIELVRSKMRQTYDLFTKRVAAGRKGIDLSKTAEGRLFTGHKAVELRMADGVGGLVDTIEALAESVRLEEYEVLDYPGPVSFEEMLEEMAKQFGVSGPSVGRVGSPLLLEMVAVARELAGPRAWQGLRDSMAAMMLLRKEPVVLVAPRAVLVR